MLISFKSSQRPALGGFKVFFRFKTQFVFVFTLQMINNDDCDDDDCCEGYYMTIT